MWLLVVRTPSILPCQQTCQPLTACPPQVLLSKGVQENKILFLSLIMAPEAVHRLCRSYPRLKLLTTEIDEGSENYQVVPGVGLFGDRYFTD